MSVKRGKLNTVSLLLWAERTTKAIGFQRTSNAIARKRRKMWATSLKRKGVKHVISEFEYQDHRCRLEGSQNTNAKWTVQSY